MLDYFFLNLKTFCVCAYSYYFTRYSTVYYGSTILTTLYCGLDIFFPRSVPINNTSLKFL